MGGRLLRILCLLAGLAGMLFCVQLYQNAARERALRENRLLSEARYNVLNITLDLNDSVSQIVNTTRRLAQELTKGTLSSENIEQQLRLEVRRNPGIQAIGVAYEPNVFSGSQRLYAPYYIRLTQSEYQLVHFEQKYDYTQLRQDSENWYRQAYQLQGSWSEPVKDPITGELHLVYAQLFYRFDTATLKHVPAGVVYAALAQDDFQKMVRAVDLGEEGYAFIVSNKGNYLVHPDQKLINTSMLSHATQNNDPLLAQDAEKVIKETLFLRNGISGNQPCWYFYEPIPDAHWSIGIVLQKDPQNAMVIMQKITLVRIGLVLLVSLILVSIFVFQLRFASLLSQWLLSVSSTIFIIGLIAFIWYLEISRPANPDTSFALTSHGALGQSLAKVEEDFQREGLPPPARIPTGLFIESFSIDGRSATITGYIWQKFPQAMAEAGDLPGVTFVDSQDESQDPAFSYTEKNIVTVGYYFRVTQEQAFTSAKYPLDQETISFQLQPASLDKNFLLVPDLDSYTTISPTNIPGLKPDLILSNWSILRSSFSYIYENRNNTFGSNTAIKLYNLPALQFDITVARFILPSILSYGITAMVIAILMFSLVVSKAENSRSVLTESFALFFVLVIAHVGLRGELAAQGVVYLETLFIILYGLILIGVLNGLLEFVDFKVPILSYRQGLLFKLFYWPILFGLFLIITLWRFYPNLLPGS